MNPINDEFFNAVRKAAATRAGHLAAKVGLSPADREDMEQDLIVDLLENAHRYDPSKGSPGTFTGLLSKHRATELLDRLMKDRRRLCFGVGSPAANGADFEFDDITECENSIPLWAVDQDLFSDSAALFDLQKAIAFMTDEQQALCHLLVSHQYLPDACKASGISSATFYRRVEQLQMHLRMFGFRKAA